MHGNFDIRSFKKITPLEAWMQTKSYRILQIRSIILAHACEERGVEFQENHPYRMPDTDNKVHFLP